VSLASHRLSLEAGSRRLLDALDLALEAGEVLGILGPNGAGKSTLLTTLAGLAAPAAGSVMLDGTPVAALPPLGRARHIALLPQGDEGAYLGSVADFVALGRYPFETGRGRAFGATDGLAHHLASWELEDLARQPLATLSGGERQRARMAQLAMQHARFALLDEPLTHLDPAHQARLLRWVRGEAEAGRGVAMTLHDPNWAACHCDRLLFLYGDGRWRVGTPAELLVPDALETLYGPGTAALWGVRAGGREPV
jgi:iron complex transport system ATP-binding protein